MQLLLTDRLACPRCGPGFGLVLLADRMVDRRVHEGTLGCPNCRDSFTVHAGFADLRAPPRGALQPGLAGPDPARTPDGERDTALAKKDMHKAELIAASTRTHQGLRSLLLASNETSIPTC